MTTKYLCHLSGHQFCDDNGDPLGSGTIETYVAGTSTNKATYKDNAGAASHANPIVLGADGRVPGDALWLDNDQGYKFVVKNSAGTTIWTHDDIEPIVPAATATQSEWVNGPTPTFISATSFSVGGDYTSTLQVGRRLKLTDSSTLYATISASSYSAGSDITTITVVVDGGSSVTSSLASLQYGVLNASNASAPILTRVAGVGANLPAPNDAVVQLTDAAHSLSVWASYVITPTTTRVLTLPTTNIKAGDQVRVINLASAQKVTINASGGSAKATFQNGAMTLYALQATPTTPAHWGILDAVGGASPCFSATIASDQTGISTSFVKITFDTEDYDNNAAYDPTTNYRFTPGVPGKYAIDLKVNTLNHGTGSVVLAVYKNGTAVRTLWSTGGFDGNLMLSCQLDLDEDDYIEPFARSSGDTNWNIDAAEASVPMSWFNAHRMGS